MVGASGLSYEEAAEVCKIAVGTVKSRVSRARTALAALLGYEAAVIGAAAKGAPAADIHRNKARAESL